MLVRLYGEWKFRASHANLKFKLYSTRHACCAIDMSLYHTTQIIWIILYIRYFSSTLLKCSCKILRIPTWLITWSYKWNMVGEVVYCIQNLRCSQIMKFYESFLKFLNGKLYLVYFNMTRVSIKKDWPKAYVWLYSILHTPRLHFSYIPRFRFSLMTFTSHGFNCISLTQEEMNSIIALQILASFASRLERFLFESVL